MNFEVLENAKPFTTIYLSEKMPLSFKIVDENNRDISDSKYNTVLQAIMRNLEITPDNVEIGNRGGEGSIMIDLVTLLTEYLPRSRLILLKNAFKDIGNSVISNISLYIANLKESEHASVSLILGPHIRDIKMTRESSMVLRTQALNGNMITLAHENNLILENILHRVLKLLVIETKNRGEVNSIDNIIKNITIANWSRILKELAVGYNGSLKGNAEGIEQGDIHYIDQGNTIDIDSSRRKRLDMLNHSRSSAIDLFETILITIRTVVPTKYKVLVLYDKLGHDHGTHGACPMYSAYPESFDLFAELMYLYIQSDPPELRSYLNLLTYTSIDFLSD